MVHEIREATDVEIFRFLAGAGIEAGMDKAEVEAVC